MPGSRIIELQSDPEIQIIMNKIPLVVVATLIAMLFATTDRDAIRH